MNNKKTNYKKHISVPIREWTNNHYSFNKSLEKHSLSYLNTSNKIIKGYLNLTPKEISFKSKRMRDLMKRSSTAGIFNSKGEIKQNGDRVNVNIYTFDKESLFRLKSLYSNNKSLSKYNKLNNITLAKLNALNTKLNNINKLKSITVNTNTNTNTNDTKSGNNIYRPKAYSLIFKSLKTNNSRYSNIYNKNINYYYRNHKFMTGNNNTDLIGTGINMKSSSSHYPLRKATFFKKKKLMLQNKRNLLYSKLISSLPWSFKNNKIMLYKITLMRLFLSTILKTNNLSYHVDKQANCLYINRFNNVSNTIIKKIKIKLPSKFMFLNSLATKNSSATNKFTTPSLNNHAHLSASINLNHLKWKRAIYINKILNVIVIKLVPLSYSLNNDNNKMSLTYSLNKLNLINTLYKEFIRNNVIKLFNHYFVKQQSIVNNIYKSFITNDKFTHLTNNLKYLINKIYNKKVNLNITALKYSHLNADIFSSIMVTKLINKRANIESIITKGFKLITLAKLIESKEINVPNNYKNGINLINLISEMYNNNESSINKLHKWTTDDSGIKANYNDKTKEIIKSLKHKWTTGVRLEGKGRLTSRYAAARAIHKYKTKGNLRSKLAIVNEDYLKLVKKGNKMYNSSPSNILFRGIHTPNIQYIRKSGFKRIGAFGVKVWINNN